jgi:hypothetical protein
VKQVLQQQLVQAQQGRQVLEEELRVQQLQVLG